MGAGASVSVDGDGMLTREQVKELTGEKFDSDEYYDLADLDGKVLMCMHTRDRMCLYKQYFTRFIQVVSKIILLLQADRHRVEQH